MASGEVHAMTGIAIQQAAEGKLWAVIPLAIASHYALDDLNWGNIYIYHGLGSGIARYLYVAFKVLVWLTLGYLVWSNPILLLGALAGMALDIEHIFVWITKKPLGTLGFHSAHRWLMRETGIIVWVVVTLLLLAVIWR